MADRYGLDLDNIEALLEPGANTLAVVETLRHKNLWTEEDDRFCVAASANKMYQLKSVTLATVLTILQKDSDGREELEAFAQYYNYSSVRELIKTALDGISEMPFSSRDKKRLEGVVIAMKKLMDDDA